MTIKCMACRHWHLSKTPPAMARFGFAVCAHQPVWVYHPTGWACQKAIKASSDVIAKREAWLTKHKITQGGVIGTPEPKSHAGNSIPSETLVAGPSIS